jgi:hypothetical protein
MEIYNLMVDTFYANVDPRRKQELADSRMIQEDHKKIANLSEKFILREFNEWRYPERLAMYNQNTLKKMK